MKQISYQNSTLFVFLLLFICFSCAPKYGAYFPKTKYEDNNYAIKTESETSDNSDNIVASTVPVEEVPNIIIEKVDIQLAESTKPDNGNIEIASKTTEIAPEERGKLNIVPKEEKNAVMTSREEMIMEALSIRLKNMTKEEKKAFRQDVKHLAKDKNIARLSGVENISSPEATDATDTNTLLLVIIAILIPPLAVFLYEGEITKNFWINLLLTLLFYIPGLIHALILIL